MKLKTAEEWITEWGAAMGLDPTGERTWVMVHAPDIKRVQVDCYRHAAGICAREKDRFERPITRGQALGADSCMQRILTEADKLENK